jgi:multidrug efflux pump subunit AcrB
MKKLINYLIEQKLLINLIVFSLLAAGFFSITHLNRESIPDIKFDMVTISTVYPGASPNEAEDLISIPIEKKLRSVSDIDKVRSYNVENVSLIVVFIEDQAKDKKKTVQDIKDAVEQVSGLPAVAQKPVVAEVSFDNTELISVAFTGKDGKDVPYSKLREFAKESEDFFYDIDGIAEVEKFGYYDREYLVEIDPDVMDKYRIGLNTLANAIKMRNIDYPGGPLRIGKKEFVLRTKGQFKNADEIRNTVIRGNDTGYALRVGDVAKVTDTYAEADVHHRFNGKQAVVFKLWKKRSADEIELAARVKKAAQSYSIPGYEDVHISFFNDSSETTQSRLSSVIHEAVVGFVILGLFMLMLLGRRMTAIVLLGIPVTYMTEFILMKYNGMTFNIMSLFGIIMVMGMVVDFSIVVSENSHRYLEHGLRKKDATIKGVSEVFGSVTVTLICIIIAFLPLLLVTGMIGKFVRPIPIIIISAMISGWIVAMFILPAYLNIFLKEEHDSGKGNIILSLINRIGSAFSRNKSYHVDSIREEDDNFEKGLFGRIQRKYKEFLTTALKHQYITAGLMLVLLVISLSLIPRLVFKFMTTGGEDKIRISVKMPFETNLETNLTEMKKIESKILSTLPQNEFKSLHVYVGEEYTSLIDPKPGKATFKSTFDIYLVKEKDRHRICDEIRDDMRNRVTEMQKAKIISGDMDIKFESVMLGPPVGKPVNVEIRGKDFATISKIADEYMGYLKSVNGVYDISIDLEGGKTEYHYTVNERMAALTGVSAYDIAEALNASFSGAVATKVNQTRRRFRYESASKRPQGSR